MIDESYRQFAKTPAQNKALDAVIKHGSNRKAADALGKSRRTVDKSMVLIKDRYDEYHGITAPDGYIVKGTSTLVDGDGNQKLQWVKTSIDAAEQKELMRSVVEAMKDDIEPCEPELPLTKECDDRLLNLFVLTDYHLGMKAWGEECGSAWDLDIAEDLLIKWFTKAIQQSPQAKTAVFAQLGDFLHWDDAQHPITPAHGHILDGDTRTQKIVRVAIRVLRRVTRMLLQKHESVHLLMAEGNHDPASSIWLRELFHSFYEDEPRITVDLSPDPYYCYEHGQTSLFFHHGHKRKPANIDTVFAAKFREVFGRTKHSFCHMGHLHSTKVIESNLMDVEQHRTLASPDSYATRGGWISGRSAKVITYHDEFGKVGSVSITPEMVQ